MNGMGGGRIGLMSGMHGLRGGAGASETVAKSRNPLQGMVIRSHSDIEREKKTVSHAGCNKRSRPFRAQRRVRSYLSCTLLSPEPQAFHMNRIQARGMPQNAHHHPVLLQLQPNVKPPEERAERMIDPGLVDQEASLDDYDIDWTENGVLGSGTYSTVRVATHKKSGRR